jgi:acyl dehydratase
MGTFDEIDVGDQLPALRLPAIDRTTLALYAGASGDHNPIHIDQDFARRAGMPDVFAHGMLSAAYLGRFIGNWAPQRQLRKLSLRFAGITHLGNTPVCTGVIVDKLEYDGEPCVKIAIKCANQYGEDKLVGEAIVAIAAA